MTQPFTPTGVPSLTDEFYYNVRLAFAVSTFTEVLLAMGLKLLELGVPSAESMEEAEKINGPLRTALFDAGTVEEHNAACDAIVRRVSQLGQLLLPPAGDGAFLVDREQIRYLLSRLPKFAPSGLVKQFEEHAELGDWYREYETNDIKHRLAVGNWIAKSRFGDIFEGLGESESFFSGLYNGGHSPASQSSSASSESGAEDQPTSRNIQPPPKQDQDAQASRPPARWRHPEEFYQNAMIALKHSSSWSIMMAVSVRLIQLGVPGAEGIGEARQTNFAVVDAAENPRKIEGRSPEEQQRAVDEVAMRLFHLGGQLPPEAADGAFLATEEQVEALVAAGISLIKADAEKKFFRAALMGSPFDGDVTVIGVMDWNAHGRLIRASEENTTNDILWALSRKLVELGKADAIIEDDTADTIQVLTVARNHAAQSGDPLHLRRAVDILRTELVRLVDLLPKNVWATDFLDTRAGVLALIGDRAQDGSGAEAD